MKRRLFLASAGATAASAFLMPLEALAHHQKEIYFFGRGEAKERVLVTNVGKWEENRYEPVIGNFSATAFVRFSEHYTESGVALVDENDRGYMSGPLGVRIFQSYRAAQIADRVTEFPFGGLSHCLDAAKTSGPWIGEEKNVARIQDKIGKATRQEILNSIPENFDKVLFELLDKGAEPAKWELREELARGTIELTPTINTYLNSKNKYGWI